MTSPVVDMYWISESVLIEWPLSDVDGNAVTTATVTGTVRGPGGSTSSIAAQHIGGGVYRATFDPPSPGRYSWRLESDAPDGVRAGVFEVLPDPEPAAPPNMDPTTEVGRVRLLIPDLDARALLFTDAQLAAFLDLEGDVVRRAAALALEVAASNEAMISKVIRTQDLSTNGPAVAAELRARAQTLRAQAQAAADEEAVGSGAGAFTIRPQGSPDCAPGYWPAWREQL